MIGPLNQVAMGEKKANIVLKNCRLANVYSREIMPQTQIAILKDRIAYVGKDASHTIGQNTAVIDLEEKLVTPGFADPHIHIDQYILPSELAKQSLLCGTTALFSDPIDIVSVCGYKGFRELVKMTESLPVRIFHMIPGGLPVDKKFSHARMMSRAEQRKALEMKNVLGMGEVFSWTKVTTRDPRTIQDISYILDNGGIVNGHTAGASDKKLNAYIASGISSCHEPIDYDQVIERLRLGMWVMMREGSIRRDLDRIVPNVLSHKTYLDRLMFCTDGVSPKDLLEFGMIDNCVRRSVSMGMELVDAITIASRNCFDYYRMRNDLGAIAPGKLADIVVFNDVENLKPDKVFVGGRLLVAHGRLVFENPRKTVSPWITKTVKIRRKFAEKDFVVRRKGTSAQALVVRLDTEIITKKDHEELEIKDDNVTASREKDVWKVAAIDRTCGTGKKSIGFLKNFGASIGAFGSTQSFHENDLVVIGSNESDMALVANELVKSQGGMAAAKDGQIICKFEMPVAGLVSKLPLGEAVSKYNEIDSKIVDLGCKFKQPHLIPLFLPFLALPEVRILYSGIVDVKNRTYLDIFQP